MLCAQALRVIQGAAAPCTPALVLMHVGKSVYFIGMSEKVYSLFSCRKYDFWKYGHRKKVAAPVSDVHNLTGLRDKETTNVVSLIQFQVYIFRTSTVESV